MIFILGIARSGTTILYKLLSQHPDLAYFCTAWKKRMKVRWLTPNRLQPLEGWAWHAYPETQYVTEYDGGKEEFKHKVLDCMRWWDRHDFIGKNPSICLRIRWLTSIYPDATYVLIKRDSQANLESLSYHMNVSLDEASRYRKIFQDALDKDKHLINNLIELDYEDFVRYPALFCKTILTADNHEWHNMKIPDLQNLNYRHRK